MLAYPFFRNLRSVISRLQLGLKLGQSFRVGTRIQGQIHPRRRSTARVAREGALFHYELNNPVREFKMTHQKSTVQNVLNRRFKMYFAYGTESISYIFSTQEFQVENVMSLCVLGVRNLRSVTSRLQTRA